MNVYGIARLAKEPELKYAPSGTAFCNLTLVWDSGFGDNKKTSFVPYVASGKNAENIQKFFAKGDQIFIKNGELQQRSWEDNDGKKHYVVEVFIKEWGFAGAKNNTPNTGDNLDVPPSEEEAGGDDLPF